MYIATYIDEILYTDDATCGPFANKNCFNLRDLSNYCVKYLQTFCAHLHKTDNWFILSETFFRLQALVDGFFIGSKLGK